LQKISALEPLWKVPPNVEVVCRQNHERRVWFFMNHSETSAKIATLPPGTNLFSGLKAPASTGLAAREVLIIQENPTTY
jgi:hypothetical protein